MQKLPRKLVEVQIRGVFLMVGRRPACERRPNGINYLMFYVPSYAWWLVLGSGVAGFTAWWLLFLARPGGEKVSDSRMGFPLLAAVSGIGLYFLEHLYRLNLRRPGESPHPLELSHLLIELVPLVLVLGLLALAVRTWLGWARLLALSMALDSFLLLFWPGPVVNHLFQLLAVVSLVWGAWGLISVFRRSTPGLAATSLLFAGGGVGTYCELGMMFL